MATVTSKQWLVNGRDALHALAIAALTTPVSILLSSIQAGNFNIDWTNMWHLALAGGAGYILKAWITPSQTITTNVSGTPPTTPPVSK